jgi:hypothetical protein
MLSKQLRKLAFDISHASSSIDFEKGDLVEHYKFGKGTVVRVDVKSYSIPMMIFDSEKLGEEICRPSNEFKKIN